MIRVMVELAISLFFGGLVVFTVLYLNDHCLLTYTATIGSLTCAIHAQDLKAKSYNPKRAI